MLFHVYCPHREDVIDGIQYDQNDFGIFDLQQVDDCFQSTTLHQLDHLLHSSPASEVCHSPHSFPLSLEISLREDKESSSNI